MNVKRADRAIFEAEYDPALLDEDHIPLFDLGSRD
jgi:hypothetical protein